MLKLYSIMRGDISMTAGKIASQSGHAYLNSYLDCLELNPQTAKTYQEGGIGTKICLVAPDKESLIRTYQKAKQYGLPCALIIDSGHIHPPHFTGESIITAVGIGPCTRDQVSHITDKFKLLEGELT
jgi:PTH2 family peptidyl-tRNA hydrolase